MTEYDFRFVVEGADVDDIDIVDRLYAELEASLDLAGGVSLLSIAAEGYGAVDAGIRAARSAEQLVPGLRVVRLDRDLVGVPEIAERAEVTRQAVHQWIDGSRHADLPPFPLPEGVVCRQRAWLWTEVNTWLAEIGKSDGFTYPSRDEISEIDAALHSGMGRLAAPALERWLEMTRRPGKALLEEIGRLYQLRVELAQGVAQVLAARAALPEPVALMSPHHGVGGGGGPRVVINAMYTPQIAFSHYASLTASGRVAEGTASTSQITEWVA